MNVVKDSVFVFVARKGNGNKYFSNLTSKSIREINSDLMAMFEFYTNFDNNGFMFFTD